MFFVITRQFDLCSAVAAEFLLVEAIDQMKEVLDSERRLCSGALHEPKRQSKTQYTALNKDYKTTKIKMPGTEFRFELPSKTGIGRSKLGAPVHKYIPRD